MHALFRSPERLILTSRPDPTPAPDEVVLRVHCAGLCRTDQLIMQGAIPLPYPLIPGHELAGEVVALGTAVQGWELNARATVHPLLGCGACAACQASQPEHCPTSTMLGLDRDGAFAEYLCVPARALWRLPEGMDWQRAAYTEPVAAALGLLKAEMTPQQRGWITGSGRITALSAQLARLHGLQVGTGSLDDVAPRSLDYVIETQLDADSLRQILGCLRPGGLLVLKSRHIPSLALPISEVVRHELRLQGLYYGSFARALELLSGSELEVKSLFGGVYGLHDWAEFVAPASESRKRFLDPTRLLAEANPPQEDLACAAFSAG
ncbi:MAG: zinc-dependent alcohol dehydrogenase [Candidatus Sericytochromatia bacterium]